MLGVACPREEIAGAVGLSVEEIDGRTPVQQVSAGTSAIVVPLKSLDSLRRCRFDLGAFAGLAAEGFPPLLYLFCRVSKGAPAHGPTIQMIRAVGRASGVKSTWTRLATLNDCTSA